MKLKILHLISGREINGALTYCKYLCEMLVEHGHEVTILCREGCWLEKRGVEGVRFVHCEMNRKPADVGRICNLIRHEGIDVIHTHMSRAHAFGVILKMACGVPVVATAHNRAYQLHWRFNDYVIANSKATLDYQRKFNGVQEHRSQKVLCFTDLQRFRDVKLQDVRRIRRQLRVSKDDFLCGCVGEVVKRKGHLYLFQALKRIVAEVPNFKLILLGRFSRTEPSTRKLRAYLHREKLHGRVKWLGLRENVQDFMTAFDLLTVPSIEEPLGLVAAEALAAGTPVVATLTGGLPEIVRNEAWGLLVPSRDPESLATAVIRLAKDRDLRDQMGTSGHNFIHEEFETGRLCNRVERIYHQVIATRSLNAA